MSIAKPLRNIYLYQDFREFVSDGTLFVERLHSSKGSLVDSPIHSAIATYGVFPAKVEKVPKAWG